MWVLHRSRASRAHTRTDENVQRAVSKHLVGKFDRQRNLNRIRLPNIMPTNTIMVTETIIGRWKICSK